MLKACVLSLALGLAGSAVGNVFHQLGVGLQADSLTRLRESHVPLPFFAYLAFRYALPPGLILVVPLAMTLRLLRANLPSGKAYFWAATLLGAASGVLIMLGALSLSDGPSRDLLLLPLRYPGTLLVPSLLGGAAMGGCLGELLDQDQSLRDGGERLRLHFARRGDS